MTKPRLSSSRRVIGPSLISPLAIILGLSLSLLLISTWSSTPRVKPKTISKVKDQEGSNWQTALTQLSRSLGQPIIADLGHIGSDAPSIVGDDTSAEELFDILGLENICQPGEPIAVLVPRPDWDERLDGLPSSVPSKAKDEVRAIAKRLQESVYRRDYVETERDKSLVARMARASLETRITIRRSSIDPENLSDTLVRFNFSRKSGGLGSIVFQFPTGQMAMWPLARRQYNRHSLSDIPKPLLMTTSQLTSKTSTILGRSVSLSEPANDSYVWVTPFTSSTAARIPQALARLLNRRVREDKDDIVLVSTGVGRASQRQRRIAHLYACRQVKRAFEKISDKLIRTSVKEAPFVKVSVLPAQAQANLRNALTAKFGAECMADAALMHSDLSRGKLVIPRDGKNTPYLLADGVSIKLFGMVGPSQRRKE